MGASCLPFISAGYIDVSLLCVLQLVCICRTRGPIIFFWVPDWAGADYVFVSAPSINANTCVFVCWHVCVSRGIRSQASPRGLGGACHFKGAAGPAMPACPPRGKSCLCGGASLGRSRRLTPEPGTCTDCHHPGRFKSWTTLWCHNPASSLFTGKYVWIREDNISGGNQCFDLRSEPC